LEWPKKLEERLLWTETEEEEEAEEGIANDTY
jgi:hypothetical protein